MNFLIYNNIKYNSLVKYDFNYILIVDYDSLEIISKNYKVDIIKYYGILGIKNYIRYNKHIIFGILISFCLFYLLINTTFDVVINVSDTELKELIEVELSKHNIKKYKKTKNFDELELIKNKILEDNKEMIEWMSITLNGCVYEINVNKRILNKQEIKEYPSNIIASKDGKIMYINSYSGQKMVDKNDYVKKGDILISGSIYKNDKLVDTISSSGKVYAEVWYTVKINIPFEFIEYIDTLKEVNHYYIEFFGKKFTILGKYDSKDTFNKKELLIDKPYLFFKLYKENKKIYEYRKYILNEKDAYDEAIRRTKKTIERKLNDDEYIISKNVLKKEMFRSKINLEVFYKVYENIADTSIIEE